MVHETFRNKQKWSQKRRGKNTRDSNLERSINNIQKKKKKKTVELKQRKKNVEKQPTTQIPAVSV